MSTNGTSSDQLRNMVRDVLREVLASRKSGPNAPTRSAEPVRIFNDADLASFVARVIQYLDSPTTAADLRSGRHTFTLQTSNEITAVPASSNGAVLSGAITEAKIEKHAAGSVIVLAPDAVLTPLARDKARQLGVKIERRRLC
jgi:hypothetical protein